MIGRFLFTLLTCCSLLPLSAQVAYAPDAKRDRFVRQLMQKMTLEEKIGQMHQLSGRSSVTGPGNPGSKAGIDLRSGRVGSFLNVLGVKEQTKLQKIAVDSTRLGIPLIFAYDIIHGFRTIFPIPLAESCSWDLDAMEQSARIAAIEGTASGISWTFAPMVDVARDARWGRIAEGAGEDPFLGSLIAKARVKGFQGDCLADKTTLLACAKHFAAYGASESGIDYHRVDLSERTLRSVYLPPFKAAVEAGVLTFMNAFHQLNGIPCTGNQYLVDQILKKEWKFPGVIVSDYNSVGEQIDHFYATDSLDAAKKAALARCDIDMCSYTYQNHLSEAVRKGLVPVSNVDDAVYRILSIKYQLGLFEDPYRYQDTLREKRDVLTAEHRKAAREMAKKSIVLLKNDRHTLPLKTETKVALIGEMAKEAKENMLGSWPGQGKGKDVRSIYDGLQAKGFKQILYHKGVSCTSEDTTGIGQAIRTAAQAEHILLCIGENRRMSGEAQSRIGIEISTNQMALARGLLALNKPITLLLCNGRPLAIPELARTVPAILEIWQLGTEAGDAVADVLTGDYNPSGKLTVSFPYHVGQMPLYYGRHSSGRPATGDDYVKERYKTGYKDAPMTALFPFGYGLSYTNFSYADLQVNKHSFKRNQSIEITLTLTNTGSVEGEEVTQLYVQNLSGRVAFPTRELKAFQKIKLAPGESRKLVFQLSAEQFADFDEHMHRMVLPGKYKLYVGSNSRDTLGVEISLL